MPGFPIEALDGFAQVKARLSSISLRLRQLEAQAADPPLVVVPATPVSTSSAADVPLWVLLTPVDGRLVTVTVLPTLSVAATAAVSLYDGNGHLAVSGDASAGSPVTLTTTVPAAGPFTLMGRTSAGVLSVSVVAASSPSWVLDDTGP